MPLIRAEKEVLVERLLNELKDSRVALVVAYTRLNMTNNDELRIKAFEQQGKIKMLSNSLMTLIFKKMNREMELPQKTLALAYGFEDEVVAAKTLVQFGKETETLEVLGGWIDGTFFDMNAVKTLSNLPGKEQLQAQVVGRLHGLISGLVYNLNYPLQKFAYVINAIEQSGGGSSAEAVSVEEKSETTPESTEEPIQQETDTPVESTTEVEQSEETKEEVKES